MSGCTSCSAKEGCSHRKGAMFEAIDTALARLYPTRAWGELSPSAWRTVCDPVADGPRLAKTLAEQLSAWVRFRAGEEEDFCDYLEVLCVGRTPCLFDLEAGHAPLAGFDGPTQEMYLRICLSRLDPLATVQQVAVALDIERPDQTTAALSGQEACLVEQPRAGVYDAFLLDRLQRIVAWLPEAGYTSVDFGDITNPPEGFSPGGYQALYGELPALVNYLFYAPPSTMQRIFTVPSRSARAETAE